MYAWRGGKTTCHSRCGHVFESSNPIYLPKKKNATLTN